MELIEQLYFRMVTPSDFRNMYGLAIPGSGGGQTYIEVAGVSDEDLLSFLKCAEKNESSVQTEKRPTFIFNCHVLGKPNQQDFLEFAPRRGRNYKISRQTTINRHPAWRPENGFPEPNKDSTGNYVDSTDFSGIIDHLLIVIIRSNSNKYYASFFDEPSMPNDWPPNIGLERLFSGNRRGVLSFNDCQVELLQDRRIPFRYISGITARFYSSDDERFPLQRIAYGAPGTGKSYEVNKEVEKYADTIRTTFHPDSDYASFVGSYKPTMKERTRTSITISGTNVTVASGSSSTEKEEYIAYEFIPQAFTNAYVQAWTKLANTPADGTPEKQYLVIEEINRGNCAQVFGDLFQLLDRDNIGYSKYPIVPDADLAVFLHNWFTGKGQFVDENDTEKSSENVFQKVEEKGTLETPAGTAKATWRAVLTGRKLILPPNLFIWATMNTSDQSLFPIDSAFKRRWEWKYVPINKPDKNEDGTDWKNWKIKIAGKSYDWWTFLEAVNQLIGEVTESEDKKLGYFFAKAENGIVSAETFVNKVAFYLWNDVFKDYGFDRDEFSGKADGPDKPVVAKAKDGQIRFTDFFEPSGNPKTEVVERFLVNLGLKPDPADGAGSEPDQPSGANGAEQVVPSPSPQVG